MIKRIGVFIQFIFAIAIVFFFARFGWMVLTEKSYQSVGSAIFGFVLFSLVAFLFCHDPVEWCIDWFKKRDREK
ncbi:MAG: hypothetical protein NT170_03725 [Candidatus Moranbacteria bacterium]|nr:hypothetical protein [Candidatus Moranbacteria bacterium]